VNGDNHAAAAASNIVSTPAAVVVGSAGGKPNSKAAGVPNGSNGAQAARRAALAASIEAAIEAERYASEHGLSVRFGSEDLRAMALSLFIQHARDGGVQ